MLSSFCSVLDFGSIAHSSMEESDQDAAMREMMGFGSFGSNKRQKLNTGSRNAQSQSKSRNTSGSMHALENNRWVELVPINQRSLLCSTQTRRSI